MDFAQTATGRERRAAFGAVARHRHASAYAAIVLSGGYEECGSSGRYRVGPGDVLFHGAFDAHLDRFGAQGAEILNIALCGSRRSGLAHIRDVDAVARLAPSDRETVLLGLLEPVPDGRATSDWPDLLAKDLRADPGLRLDDWACANGLARETLSRGFRKLYGTTPAEFRSEARALQAYGRIVRGSLPLAEIAALTGHADQAHMTRAVKALTGASPRQIRSRRRAGAAF